MKFSIFVGYLWILFLPQKLFALSIVRKINRFESSHENEEIDTDELISSNQSL